MDRNISVTKTPIGCVVALRKESVDRNTEDWLNAGCLPRSLSARRAWIEIWWLRCWQLAARVALRKESVDRNIVGRNGKLILIVALRKESVDRNVNLRVLDGSKSVALRKESVDRNIWR